MPKQMLLAAIWTPEDAHEVFERAATYQAGRDLEPVELGEAVQS